MLIIALDVCALWREDEIIGGQTPKSAFKRPVPDTHTHPLTYSKHTFSHQAFFLPAVATKSDAVIHTFFLSSVVKAKKIQL